MKGIAIKIKKYSKIEWIKTFISCVFAILCVYYTKNIINTNDYLSYTNSIIPIIVFIIYFIIFKKALEIKNNSLFKIAIPLSLIYSTFLAMGVQIYQYGEVLLKKNSLYQTILVISILFCAILLILLEYVEKVNDNYKIEIHPYKNIKRKLFICWTVIFISWIPIFLAAYPGYFCYDVYTEYIQYTTNSVNLLTPPLHTYLLGFCIKYLSQFTGSFNTAIAIYTIVQMLVISGVFTIGIKKMYEWNVPRWQLILVVAYYSFFPIISMFSMCATKDVLFTAFFLLFIVYLINFYRDIGSFFVNIKNSMSFILIIVTMLLLRNNAILAFIVLLPFMIYFSKGFRIKLSIVISLALIVFVIIMGPLYNAIGVGKGNSRELLSLPLQQLARAYVYDKGVYSEEDKLLLLDFVPEEDLLNYKTKSADPVKIRFDNELFLQNKNEFLKLWVKIGLKDPGVYLDAFLNNTVDMWYPEGIINGYNAFDDPGVFEKGEHCYFKCFTEQPGYPESKFPLLQKQLLNISRNISFEKIPIISMLFSIGFMFWILLFCLGYVILKRNRVLICPLLFMLFYAFTYLLGPMILPRYFLFLFFVMPIIVSLTFGSKFKIINVT